MVSFHQSLIYCFDVVRVLQHQCKMGHKGRLDRFDGCGSYHDKEPLGIDCAIGPYQ